MAPANDGFGKISVRIVAVFLVLFSGYAFNAWHAASEGAFREAQRDMESLVVARVVRSRAEGFFSDAGLIGIGNVEKTTLTWNDAPFELQYFAYMNGIPFMSYNPYNSHIGGQALPLGLVDRWLPLAPEARFALLRGMTAAATAAALSVFVFWVWQTFGLFAAIATLVSLALAQWLTYFGRNLFWSLWGFYAPFIGMLYYCRNTFGRAHGKLTRLFFLAAACTAVKSFFTGFDFSTTSVVMMATPVLFYSLLEARPARDVVKAVATALAGAVSGTALGVFYLLLQIGVSHGSLFFGLRHVLTTIQRRTYGDPQSFGEGYRVALTMPLGSVLERTLTYVYFDFGNWLPPVNSFVTLYVYRIRMLHFIGLLVLGSALVLTRNAVLRGPFGRAQKALLATAWFSLLAPISYFVAFKGLTAGHPHLVPLAWHMPFTLFVVPAVASVVCTYFERDGQRVGTQSPRP